jgi:hypothetical protein
MERRLPEAMADMARSMGADAAAAAEIARATAEVQRAAKAVHDAGGEVGL